MGEASLPVPIGTIVDGRYRIARLLGRGGMGAVFEAEHLLLERRVAIKFLFDTSRTESFGRFTREAQVTARLTSKHATRVLDVATPAGMPPYIVMELLRGRDLAAVLEQQGPMPLERAVGYVLQACDAVAEAHAKGIVHRDLKPGNLFLARQPDGSECIKVVDFGLSKLIATDAGPRLSTTASIMGSPAYMSPEQLRSAKRVDGRTDVWSLGVVLYELVTGVLPFEYESTSDLLIAIASDPHVPVRTRRANLPSSLEDVFTRCFAKNSDGRYPTVAEFARALTGFAAPEDRALIDAIARARGDTDLSGDTDGGADAPPPASASRAATTQVAVSTTVHKSVPKRVRRFVSGLAFLAALSALLFAFVGERTPTASTQPQPQASPSPSPSPSPSASSPPLARPSASAAPKRAKSR